MEDHVTIISEPGSEFVYHVTPNGNSNAENITTAIITRLHFLEDDISKIKVLKYYLIYTRGIIIGPKPTLDLY